MKPDQSHLLFEGFSKLSRPERLKRLVQMGALSSEDIAQLDTPLKTELAENFIENVIGYFHLPLGVATNLRIDGKDKVVPMAVEETSIIAAVSKTAKWIRQHGSIQTQTKGKLIIGQIQLAKVNNIEHLAQILETNKSYLIDRANQEVAHGLVARGGGVKDFILRKIDRGDGYQMAVIHIHMDACDAMGANIMNQVCEFLKEPIQQLSNETVSMCILSNLVDTKLTRACVRIHNIDPYLGNALSEASLFAEKDPYRAATNNKGVLNGIDPILIATGNDWRAVEAGIHAYAARDGQYRSITRWYMEEKDLIGEFEAPIIVGTVGGVTRLHPTAKMCLQMLDVQNAEELSRIIAAVGLVQNLGAIRALCTDGIIKGHMKLHIDNLALGAGAKEKELPLIRKRLEEILALTKRISLTHAIDALKELREPS